MTAVLPTTPSQIRALRQPPGPTTYTVKEVAALLGLHLGGVYELLQDGTIPAKQFRRRWIISRNQFHAWLDSAPEQGN